MIDYTILYRRRVDLAELSELSRDWTTFVSAYNDSSRVQKPFDAVEAATKHWLVHREYQFRQDELPVGDVFRPSSFHEADFWREYEEESGTDLAAGGVCIDSTGFMRPHLSFFVARLHGLGVRRFHALYTDPERYVKAENTEFTKGPVLDVRQVAGFEGSHSTDISNDILIIGAGYDDELIRRVAESKANARKQQLFGLPSLQPDMYQQSVIRAARASEAVGAAAELDLLFAPANDPFVTAQVLHDRLRREEERAAVTNLYLSALGTKPQVLGFTLFYLAERQQTATSLLFPYVERYTRETTKGISRIWLYTFEFP